MADCAGGNLYARLKERFGGADSQGPFFLVKLEGKSLFAERLPEADLYLFASRHSSESGKPTLCVHAPGNWSSAMMGGNPRELAATDAPLMKSLLMELKKEKEDKKLEYEVTMECTHHGPTSLHKPCVFIEVGSGEAQWNDTQALDAVVNAILRAPPVKWTPCVGFGGGHYPIILTRVQLETEYALGHIWPKYEELDYEMIQQAVRRCHAQKLIIDWKGTNESQHDAITSAAEKLGLELLRANKLLD
jgi:D-aminoacyl-tRNA deacylase